MKPYLSIGKQWGLRILAFLLCLLLLFFGGMTLILAEVGGYSLTEEETMLYTTQNMVASKAYDICHDWELKNEYGVSEYSLSPDFRGKTHLKFRILSPNGKKLYSNMTDTDSVSTDAAYRWKETEQTLPIYSYTYSGNDVSYSDYYVYYGTTIGDNDTHLYTIVAFYGEKSEMIDLFDLMHFCIGFAHPIRYFLPVILIALAVALVLCCYHLAVHTGHRQYLPDHPSYRGEVVLSFFDRIPYDLYCCILLGIFAFCIALLDPLYQKWGEDLIYLAMWGCICLVLVMLAVGMAFVLTTITRWKAKEIWKNTIVWRCCTLVWRIWLRCWRYIKLPFVRLGKLFRALPMLWKTAVFTPIVLIFFGILSFLVLENGFTLFLWGLVALAIYLAVLYAAYCFRLLMKAGHALADGDLRYKTDTHTLMLVFREHGENLNRIGDGMEKALSEKIKSERFKTELITNVSHDIKTPLTCIINYTDLLSREPLDGKAKEYTDVLSRQSARLKKLIEDLIEASKASTGNIAVSLERLDVCQIVRQSLGEYAERLEGCGLRIVETIPDGEIFANVDGRQLWRVLDNLYSNVCKYALNGTRVYVIVVEDEGEVTISIKNISRDPLTTAADELTERFVQGDASRASEGSGLGLNIAKSLTELQHGTFTIRCDGDLFRVDVTFPVVL